MAVTVAAMLTMVVWPGTEARAMRVTTTMTMVPWPGIEAQIEAQAKRKTTMMTTTRITPPMQPGKPQKMPVTLQGKRQKTPMTLQGKPRKTEALPEMTLM
ncbi:hypothetical protein D3C73_1542290 [compost metagenome]